MEILTPPSKILENFETQLREHFPPGYFTGYSSLIFFDIDGCLTDGKNQSFDLENLQQLRDWLNSHPQVMLAFCTARGSGYVEVVQQVLGIAEKKGVIICENGNTINAFGQNKEIYAGHIDRDTLKQEIETSGVNLEVEHGKTHILTLKAPQEIIEQGKEAEVAHVQNQYSCVNNLLKDRYQITLGRDSIEITPKGVSKRSAIETLAKATGNFGGIPEVLGTDDADDSWLRSQVLSGIFIPRNANEAVKATLQERLTQGQSACLQAVGGKTLGGVLEALQQLETTHGHFSL